MIALTHNQHIDLLQFIPQIIYWNRNTLKIYPLFVEEKQSELVLRYSIASSNQYGQAGKRAFSQTIYRYISRTENTFEVIGLLQAEMGKQQDGKLSFSNHETAIINKVIHWFETELHLSAHSWRWSIKLNIRESRDSIQRIELENELIGYWLKHTNISFDSAYPKKVTYISSSPHIARKTDDFGTLVIEIRSNILSQIVKILVRTITHNIIQTQQHEIRGFVRGIIAGEGCVELELKSKHYRVQISGVQDAERRIYQAALSKLNIRSNNYRCSNAVMISRKKNHLQLLKQGLLTLSPEKYAKFLRMIAHYTRY